MENGKEHPVARMLVQMLSINIWILTHNIIFGCYYLSKINLYCFSI